MTKTTHMRVPINFKKTVERIADRQNVSMTNLLAKDGVTIFENAEYATKLTGLFRFKRRKTR